MSGGTRNAAGTPGRGGAVEVAVRADAALGEGPTWDPAARRLIWVDILGARIHGFDPATGRRTVMATEQHVGAARPREGGGLVVNLRDGVAVYGPDGTGFRWLHRDPVPGRRGNEAVVAPDGSLWAGTMYYDEAPGGGTLTRIAADGTARRLLSGGAVSNGTGWSPDGRFLYYADSPTRRIDVFDVRGGAEGATGGDSGDDGGGLLAGRRPFAEIETGAGFPDGLTVDAEGCVWVALWDGAALRRYTPSGALDRVIELPVRRPTAPVFGGDGLRDLYVTTARTGLAAPHPLAGSVLVLPDAGQGLAQPAFAG